MALGINSILGKKGTDNTDATNCILDHSLDNVVLALNFLARGGNMIFRILHAIRLQYQHQVTMECEHGHQEDLKVWTSDRGRNGKILGMCNRLTFLMNVPIRYM